MFQKKLFHPHLKNVPVVLGVTNLYSISFGFFSFLGSIPDHWCCSFLSCHFLLIMVSTCSLACSTSSGVSFLLPLPFDRSITCLFPSSSRVNPILLSYVLVLTVPVFGFILVFVLHQVPLLHIWLLDLISSCSYILVFLTMQCHVLRSTPVFISSWSIRSGNGFLTFFSPSSFPFSSLSSLSFCSALSASHFLWNLLSFCQCLSSTSYSGFSPLHHLPPLQILPHSHQGQHLNHLLRLCLWLLSFPCLSTVCPSLSLLLHSFHFSAIGVMSDNHAYPTYSSFVLLV